jgi:hypothetical protein
MGGEKQQMNAVFLLRDALRHPGGHEEVRLRLLGGFLSRTELPIWAR